MIVLTVTVHIGLTRSYHQGVYVSQLLSYRLCICVLSLISGPQGDHNEFSLGIVMTGVSSGALLWPSPSFSKAALISSSLLAFASSWKSRSEIDEAVPIVVDLDHFVELRPCWVFANRTHDNTGLPAADHIVRLLSPDQISTTRLSKFQD